MRQILAQERCALEKEGKRLYRTSIKPNNLL